jgi:hypothetical protein
VLRVSGRGMQELLARCFLSLAVEVEEQGPSSNLLTLTGGPIGPRHHHNIEIVDCRECFAGGNGPVFEQVGVELEVSVHGAIPSSSRSSVRSCS